MMPRPRPLLSTTTKVMMLCRARAPKLFAPKTSAYLSVVKSAAIWYLREGSCFVKYSLSSPACDIFNLTLVEISSYIAIVINSMYRDLKTI